MAAKKQKKINEVSIDVVQQLYGWWLNREITWALTFYGAGGDEEKNNVKDDVKIFYKGTENRRWKKLRREKWGEQSWASNVLL